jgi:hypothetical protein
MREATGTTITYRSVYAKKKNKRKERRGDIFI